MNLDARRIAIVLGVAGLALACVHKPYERTKSARAEYEACLEEHPETPEACDELRELARREYDRYEEDAQRHWGDRERSWTP